MCVFNPPSMSCMTLLAAPNVSLTDTIYIIIGWNAAHNLELPQQWPWWLHPAPPIQRQQESEPVGRTGKCADCSLWFQVVCCQEQQCKCTLMEHYWYNSTVQSATAKKYNCDNYHWVLTLQLSVPSRETTYWCSNHYLAEVTKLWEEEVYIYKVTSISSHFNN